MVYFKSLHLSLVNRHFFKMAGKPVGKIYFHGEMKKRFCFPFLIFPFCFFSCKHPETKNFHVSFDSSANKLNEESSHENPVALRKQYLDDIKKYDTLTARGNYLHYSLDSMNNVLITWGNFKTGDIGTREDENLFGICLPSRFDCEWKNYVGIAYACNCHYTEMNLLPLNKKDSILTYYGTVDIDTSQNLLLTWNGDSIYTLEDIATKTHIDITLTGLATFSEVEHHFVPGGIYFKWKYRYQELVGCKSGTREKTFHIHH